MKQLHYIYNRNPALTPKNKSENMRQANKQDMENKGKGAVGGRERPFCVPRALTLSNPHSLPAEIETPLGISLSLPETTE